MRDGVKRVASGCQRERTYGAKASMEELDGGKMVFDNCGWARAA